MHSFRLNTYLPYLLLLLLLQLAFTPDLLGSVGLDTTFGNPPTNGYVIYTADSSSTRYLSAMALQTVQTDVKIVVTGWRSSAPIDDIFVARFNSNGTPDTTFGDIGPGASGNGFVYWNNNGMARATALIIQPNNKIVIAGYSVNDVSGRKDGLLIRYNEDGRLDTSFNSTGYKFISLNGTSDLLINGLALHPDGYYLITGTQISTLITDPPPFFPAPPISEMFTARLNSDGTLDSAFNTTGSLVTTPDGFTNPISHSIAVQQNGGVISTGEMADISTGQTSLYVMRQYADGIIDLSFGANGLYIRPNAFGNAVTTLADNRIVAVGYNMGPPTSSLLLLQLTSSGSLDASFAGGEVIYNNGIGSAVGTAVALQPDGKVVVTGYTFGGSENEVLALRYNIDGTPDVTFGPGGVFAGLTNSGAIGNAVAVQSDNKIVVAGMTGTSFSDVMLMRLTESATPPKTPATITLDSFRLAQTYDSNQKAVTATTVPPGLAVDFTYNSLPDVPTNAGSYAVVGTINNVNYSGSASGTLVISKAAASVVLGTLTATYDGTAKAATATTTPTGLTVAFTYAGSTTAPTNAGSYAVVGTISDTNYSGSANGTLVISKAAASANLGALAATYDGTAKAATATTTPTGLTVDYTYAGSTTAPTNAGSYAVVGTINDANYSGSASDTLVISKAAASANLGALAATYDGTAKAATATTTPTGLTVAFTYAGSSTAPTNAGSYDVVGTINDTNYSGSASGSLVISKAAATAVLGSLTATYDGTAKAATATTTPTGLTVDYTYAGSTTAPTNAGSYAVVGTINDTNYSGSASGPLVISKATPTITWAAPTAINYGTVLSATQLNATASVPGSFIYTPDASTPLNAGTNQLSVQFTPTDSNNYNSVTASNSISVVSAPTDGTLTVVPGNGQATLIWNGFLDAVSYVLISSTTTVPANCVGGNTVTSSPYPVTNLANDVLINFRLCALDTAGNVSTGVTASTTPKQSFLTIGPATADFGDQIINTSSGSKSFSLSNIGTMDLVVSSLSSAGTSAGDYSITGGSCTNAPFTLTAGTACSVEVTFKPLIRFGASRGSTVSAITSETGSPTISAALSGTVLSDGVLSHSNNTGQPTLSDALILLQITSGNLAATPEQLKHGDVAPLVNGVPAPNGVLDNGDTLVLLRRVVGLVSW